MTNCERETIILTNKEQDYYSVYTYNGKLKRRLATFGKANPGLCNLKEQASDGAATYHVDKACLVLQARKPFGENSGRTIAHSARPILKDF